MPVEHPPSSSSAPPPEVDRFSHLPDDVLLSILARLPVRKLVALSALSRSWRRLLASLPRLERVYCEVSSSCLPLPPEPFPHGHLRHCHIVYTIDVPLDARLGLLRSAEDGCVQKLTLDNRQAPITGRDEVLNLALSIKTLTDLELLDSVGLPRPSACRAHFFVQVAVLCNQLRTLEIRSYCIHQHVLYAILATCSALEKLHLVDCFGFHEVTVLSRSLKKLRLKPAKYIAGIVVDAPELEVLELQTRPNLHVLDVLRAPKTQEVRFDFASPLQSPQVRMKGFLRTARDLMSLTLNSAALKVLAMECEEHKLNLSFEKMKTLSICLDIKLELHVQLLVKLLESCPYLWSLNLKVIHARPGKDNAMVFSKHTDRLEKSECVTHLLKEVNMELLLRVRHERELARFFMTKAKGLEKMSLKVPASRVRNNIKDGFPLNDARSVNVDDEGNGTKTIKITF